MYSHDGIKDVQTQLAAPTLLYEELRREMARANRENRPVSLVRFVLVSPDFHNGNVDYSSFSYYQNEIVRFAHTLTRLSREEDVCARMGEREFVCILRGDHEAAQIYISRIMLCWREENAIVDPVLESDSLRLNAASLVSGLGENALELLNRLDLVPLSAL